MSKIKDVFNVTSSNEQIEAMPDAVERLTSDEPMPVVMTPRDGEASTGAAIAAQLHALKFHPVVVFGGPASGKTSLVVSMLAALRLEAEWGCGATLCDPILPLSDDRHKEQYNDATRLFNKTVQEFIAGTGAGSTRGQQPFFVPVAIRSTADNRTVKFAFLESNGEWYKPKTGTDEFFAALRADTDAFIRNYEGGISFIYVLPYTQNVIRSSFEKDAEDPEKLREAGLAIVGMLDAYSRVRTNTRNDGHLLLVSKWDAHHEAKKSEEDIELWESLLESDSDIEAFLARTYPQALASFKGLAVDAEQRRIGSYCAGLMTARTIQPVAADPDTRYAIRWHQKKVWRWVWRNATTQIDVATDLFPPDPVEKKSIWQSINSFLDRYF
jgi:hypothetical protein